jgi:hypothetical protein
MHRCAPWVALAATVALALPAAAQMQRSFPKAALRGEVTFGPPPEVKLNGEANRLAPGARIHDADNLLKMSGSLVGQTLVVNYTVDHMGQLHDVWLLTDAEAARKPWPKTAAEAQAWKFDPLTQTWSKP